MRTSILLGLVVMVLVAQSLSGSSQPVSPSMLSDEALAPYLPLKQVLEGRDIVISNVTLNCTRAPIVLEIWAGGNVTIQDLEAIVGAYNCSIIIGSARSVRVLGFSVVEHSGSYRSGGGSGRVFLEINSLDYTVLENMTGRIYTVVSAASEVSVRHVYVSNLSILGVLSAALEDAYIGVLEAYGAGRILIESSAAGRIFAVLSALEISDSTVVHVRGEMSAFTLENSTVSGMVAERAPLVSLEESKVDLLAGSVRTTFVHDSSIGLIHINYDFGKGYSVFYACCSIIGGHVSIDFVVGNTTDVDITMVNSSIMGEINVVTNTSLIPPGARVRLVLAGNDVLVPTSFFINSNCMARDYLSAYIIGNSVKGSQYTVITGGYKDLVMAGNRFNASYFMMPTCTGCLCTSDDPQAEKVVAYNDFVATDGPYLPGIYLLLYSGLWSLQYQNSSSSTMIVEGSNYFSWLANLLVDTDGDGILDHDPTGQLPDAVITQFGFLAHPAEYYLPLNTSVAVVSPPGPAMLPFLVAAVAGGQLFEVPLLPEWMRHDLVRTPSEENMYTSIIAASPRIGLAEAVGSYSIIATNVFGGDVGTWTGPLVLDRRPPTLLRSFPRLVLVPLDGIVQASSIIPLLKAEDPSGCPEKGAVWSYPQAKEEWLPAGLINSSGCTVAGSALGLSKIYSRTKIAVLAQYVGDSAGNIAVAPHVFLLVEPPALPISPTTAAGGGVETTSPSSPVPATNTTHTTSTTPSNSSGAQQEGGIEQARRIATMILVVGLGGSILYILWVKRRERRS
ncbi:MAG: hypothetical protein F7C34_05145 [Desulfurococcales archaeon]|nr:hypothetical protein [Desulfurococcales archaeon]